MPSNDLHQAVGRVAAVLEETGIRSAVDRFRAARGDESTVAAARLGQVGAAVSERFQRFGAIERRVIKSLHLDSLASAEYWQQLVEATSRPGDGRGDIVKLAARLMFATQNLPGLTALLSDADADAAERTSPLASGEARLQVRLIDTGERASSPDRIARAIDGIDMLYSACASIARRPSMDLRLDAIDGVKVRDLHFTGDREAVAAVVAVMHSVPGALQIFGESGDVDLDALVASLPVFSDLETLGSMGSFSSGDLSNISETLRQGALLVLESGIVLRTGVPARAADNDASIAVERAGEQEAPDTTEAGASADQHYEAYLREREAMRTDLDDILGDGESDAPVQSSVEIAKARLGTTMEQDRARRIEVENMLAELKGQRSH